MGMFDLTPENVAMLQQQGDTQAGINAANAGPTGAILSAGAVGGRLLGRGVAGALGYQDPMMHHAQRLQAAMHDTNASGHDIAKDPMGFYQEATKNLVKYGLYDQAFQVQDKIKELAQTQASMAQARKTNFEAQRAEQAQFVSDAIQKEWLATDGKDMRHLAEMLKRHPLTLDIGNKLESQMNEVTVVPPNSDVIRKQTGETIPIGGPNVLPRFDNGVPGEMADETNRRVLNLYANLASQRPLANAELISATQRYNDYLNPQVQGVGKSNREVDPRLNPATWGQGRAQQQGATGPVTSAQQTLVGPVTSTGIAGRTAPIVTSLPGTGKNVEPGIFQGAAGQKRLDDETNNFAKEVIKNQIPQLDRAFANVRAVLDAYPEDKTPGIGGAWNSPLAGYVISIGQKLGSPELSKELKEARDVRTSVQTVSNYIIRIMAGLNQTQGEAARTMMEQATGQDATEADFRNAFAKLLVMYQDTRSGVVGGYPIEVRQKYTKQSGLNMVDPRALPAPTMKTLPQKAIVRPSPNQPPDSQGTELKFYSRPSPDDFDAGDVLNGPDGDYKLKIINGKKQWVK